MQIYPLPDIPLRQTMLFNPIWVAGLEGEDYFHRIDLFGNDVFGTPGIMVGTVYSVQVSPGVIRWKIGGLDEYFITKAEAMMFLQGLEHEREERIMRQHYAEYMRKYHIVLGQMLNKQAPTYQPAVY